MKHPKRFHLNQVVHIDTDHAEYGRVCGTAIVKDRMKNDLFVQVDSIGANIYVSRMDANAVILAYDYYIQTASKSVERSNGLWLHVNRAILQTLVDGQKQGLTLKEVAKTLYKLAGRRSKNEPVCITNFRSAAKSISQGVELVLM